MGNESELGKGLFGYRKSAVEQIMSDRDQMLRQAEGRVRAAESKVAELETELNAMNDRNTRMDEQIDRLRAQLEEFARTQASSHAAPVWTEPQAPDAGVPPAVEVPIPSPAVPVTDAPEPGGVADLPVDPGPAPVPTAAEPTVTQSGWDEPTAWSEPEPASGYQEYQPRPEPAQEVAEIAYAPDDRYGYAEAGELTMPEPMPEAQAPQPFDEGWTSEPPASESASVGYDPEPTLAPEPEAFQPEAYQPEAYQPESAFAPEPEAFQPESVPAATEDVAFGFDAATASAPPAVAPEPIVPPQAEPESESPRVDDLTQRFLNDELGADPSGRRGVGVPDRGARPHHHGAADRRVQPALAAGPGRGGTVRRLEGRGRAGDPRRAVQGGRRPDVHR